MSDGMLLFPIGYAPTSDGAVVPGGKLHFTRTGTSTAQDTYSDSALNSANANPVVLNAEGYLDTKIYGDPDTGFNYRVRLTDANDVEIWSVDDVSCAVDATQLGGVASSDFARLSQNNTFTGATQTISAAGTTEFRVTDSADSVTAYVGAFNGGAYLGARTNHSAGIYTNDTARLVVSNGGNFDFKGGTASNFVVQTATAAAIAAAANAINTSGKVAGKLLLDTTNHKLYTARGANATDPWDLADGSASVTPS